MAEREDSEWDDTPEGDESWCDIRQASSAWATPVAAVQAKTGGRRGIVKRKAEEWGINRQAAARILKSGRSEEGMSILVEQAKRMKKV